MLTMLLHAYTFYITLSSCFIWQSMIYWIPIFHLVVSELFATIRATIFNIINRGSYMSAHVLLNLLSKLGKIDKMGGLPSILSLLPNKLNKFNITRA